MQLDEQLFCPKPLTNARPYGIIILTKERGVIQMTTLKKFFELNKPYKFDVNDLTALIYVICAVLGSIGYNVTILFLIGSAIGSAFCWQARRINLVVLNLALFGLNVVSTIKMFI
jgi:hypothetical protein